MNTQHHPYHLVDLSPWPILSAFALLILAGGGVMFMHNYSGSNYALIAGLGSIVFCLYNWWKDVVNEGLIGQHHTSPVRQGLRIGMALFILSEVAFFFAFFWSFFHASLFPKGILEGLWNATDMIWPPKGIHTLDPWDVPFINTLILLLSGTTITWAHYALEEDNHQDFITGLRFTILLGIFFTSMQIYEYHHATFKFKDGIYASNFYLATGFHGVHVIIGTIFLTISYFRALRGDFESGNSQLGFEFAAWYWHFVDVVWLLLFAFIYVWGR